MLVVKNRLMILLAEKARREGKTRIPVKHAAAEMEVSYYTLSKIASDTIEEYPKDVLSKICRYLDCTPGDLLVLEETASTD
jgi:DNA-binding Xre family transcriptional regulator